MSAWASVWLLSPMLSFPGSVGVHLLQLRSDGQQTF